MNVTIRNLFADLPAPLPDERFDALLDGDSFRMERIVSTGQATPAGQWYDQEREEWVLVLRGAARLLVEGGGEAVPLGPGDYVRIPAHCRHRVQWTTPDEPTVWLALHFKDAKTTGSAKD